MNKILSHWYKGDVCSAPGVLSTDEDEILSASGSIEDAEEEPDLDLAYDQLEAIMQRLKHLRGKLLLSPADPCELELGTLSEAEDTCCLTPNQLMLQQLRHRNCMLRCQLQRQAQHLHSSRKQLKLLESMRCQLNDRLQKMSAELNAFDQFKMSAQHQFGLCIERNEQIKASKIDEFDFRRHVRDVITQCHDKMSPLVPMRCHRQIRNNFSVELLLIRVFLHTLFSNMVEDWSYCKKRQKKNCICI
ncbi:uncharacterized protein LOC116805047 [Drosophila grimshawi]|uniref:uncharacterized protein LOC116805047 n=1 Tax=Drosophila grimshawi TaxID=7222 RepID=UPI000C870E80|nr:uncharacterized protein LOC116805047 [Drosophila grimshawi]